MRMRKRKSTREKKNHKKSHKINKKSIKNITTHCSLLHHDSRHTCRHHCHQVRPGDKIHAHCNCMDIVVHCSPHHQNHRDIDIDHHHRMYHVLNNYFYKEAVRMLIQRNQDHIGTCRHADISHEASIQYHTVCRCMLLPRSQDHTCTRHSDMFHVLDSSQDIIERSKTHHHILDRRL